MKKYVLISLCIAMYTVLLSSPGAQQVGEYDMVLKGGHVIDPANSVNRIMDVAVKNGKIARVAGTIPAGSAAKTVDVSGYYVVPGLVDIHTHVFHTFDLPGRWVIPDHHSFQSCVTTVVDAGTSGADSFEDFKKIIDSSNTRILAFLNIAAPGKNDAQNDPSCFDVSHAVETAKKYPDIIVGFKSCDFSANYDEIHTPWVSVDSTLAAGRMAGLPVMVSFGPRPPQKGYPARSYRELIGNKLRPGDIHTCFFAPNIPVLREDGEINPDIREARTRGVMFDSAHGAGSFVFRNAVPAIDQGFLPDTISTDLHGAGRTRAVVDMMNIMSKFLCCGMSLEDVIRCSTINPARAVNHPELGSLSVGATADIAVIDLISGNFGYMDTRGGKNSGDKKLLSIMTLFAGKIVFDPFGVSCPEWETIPENDTYWVNSSGQTW